MSLSKEPKFWFQEREKLTSLIQSCLDTGRPRAVNLSLPRHYITTPVLRKFAYERRYHGKLLPVVFLDGSQPKQFPIGCLNSNITAPSFAESVNDPRVIKVGLMSFRHPEMDFLVDYYITQNRELAAEDAMAEEEETSYRRTYEAFLGMQNIEVWAFHTGLEPMVVGFYRAVTEVLRQSTRGFVVRPWFYRPPKGYQDTEILTPKSAGATIEAYFPGEPWF